MRQKDQEREDGEREFPQNSFSSRSPPSGGVLKAKVSSLSFSFGQVAVKGLGSRVVCVCKTPTQRLSALRGGGDGDGGDDNEEEEEH